MTTTMPMPMPFLLMEELPSELFLLHVLTRLPLKYLMRLRCVSKFFLDLTNNPDFITSYRSKSNPSSNHLPLDDFNFMETSPPPPPPSPVLRLWRIHILFKGSNYIYIQKSHELIPFHCPKDKRLINSINGLVCFGGIDSLEIYNIFAGTNYYLIPPIFTPDTPRYKHPKPKYAFGYDPISNDYKILRIEYSFSWSIYSFGTNSWKSMSLYLKYSNLLNSEVGRSVCINGVIYWPPGCRGEYRNKIVMFDLHKEKFGVIKLPKEDLLLPTRYEDTQLLSFRGCIAFAFIRRTSTKKSREEMILGGRGGGGGGEGEQATSHGDGDIWVVELFTLKRNKLWYTQSFVVPIPAPTKEDDEVEIVSCCDEIFLGWFESNQLIQLYNLHSKRIFNLALSTSPSHYYPKASFIEKKDNPTYVDNLSFDFSLI